MPNLRQATPSDLDRIAEAYLERKRFEKLQMFVAIWFGPGAVRAELGSSVEYNDENYEAPARSIGIRDQSGREVKFDPEGPGWSQYMEDKDTKAVRERWDYDDYYWTSGGQAYQEALAGLNDIPDGVYDLTVAPSELTFRVFVEV